MAGPATDVLAWLTVGLLTVGVLLQPYDRTLTRHVLSGAWISFAVFWGLLAPHFVVVQHSIVEGIGSLIAVPASLYVAYLHADGRDSLFRLSRAVAVMGLLYVPFALVRSLRKVLVEVVSAQAHLLITAVGYDPVFTTSPINGFHSAFVFTTASGHPLSTTVVLACTGIGSMSIMSGLISAVDASVRRRARMVAIVVPTIWSLNLVRVTFITVAFGNQWFQILVGPITTVVGYSDSRMVSYFVADRLLAQSLSVVALIGLIWFVGRRLPELLSLVEEVLYVITTQEYDLTETVEAT